MDDRQFDSIVRSLAVGKTRRQALKGLLGIGVVAITGTVGHTRGAEAARRGFSGPSISSIFCPGGATLAGGVCQCSADRTPCISGDTNALVSCCTSSQICCFDGSCIASDGFCAF